MDARVSRIKPLVLGKELGNGLYDYWSFCRGIWRENSGEWKRNLKLLCY